MRMLLLVADEEHGVAIFRPQFLDELLAHEVLPVRTVADIAPQRVDLPVHDRLSMAVT